MPYLPQRSSGEPLSTQQAVTTMLPAKTSTRFGMSQSQIALVRKTVARDCDRDSKGNDLHLGEFDWAMEICTRLKLNPLLRQVYFFVFHKDDPARRQMVPVIGISGYRTIAKRSGNYRPDDDVPTFEYDEKEKGPHNPRGIVKVTCKVWQHAHGEWHPIKADARWDAYAPIVEAPSGGKKKMRKVANGKVERRLDPNKARWATDPEGMLAKCCESQCIRKGWPDELEGTYGDGELDQAETIELTATEIVEKAAAENRLALIGGADAIIVQWEPNGELARVPVGKFVDEALKWAHDKTRKGVEITDWQVRNRVTLQEFWARHKGDALALRDALGERLTQLAETEAKKATTDETPQAQAIKADERAGQGCHG